MNRETDSESATSAKNLLALEAMIANDGNIELICHRAATMALTTGDANGVTVTTRDGGDLVYVVALGSARTLLGTRTPIVLSFTGVVMLSRQPRVFEPETAPPSSQGRAKEAGFRSGVVVPILDGNKPLGTIGLTSKQPGAFTDENSRELTEIAALLGRALARSYAEPQTVSTVASS